MTVTIVPSEDDSSFDIDTMIVQNNLRSDLPHLFSDDYEGLICAMVILMQEPVIGGGKKMLLKEIAQEFKMPFSTFFSRISRWKSDGTWQRALGRLVSTLHTQNQIANMNVLAHYPVIVQKVMELALNVSGKVSPRTQLDAQIAYLEKLLPLAERQPITDDEAIQQFAEKYKIPAPKPDITDALEVSSEEDFAEKLSGDQ